MFWILAAVWVLLMAWGTLGQIPAGKDGRAPIPYLIALHPFMAIVAVMLLVVTLWAEPTLGGFAILALGWVCMPGWRYRYQKRMRSDRKQSTGAIRVMTLNCRFGRADAEAIVSAVREQSVQVLALQELTAELLARLDQAGLNVLLPYHSIGADKPDDNGGFNGIWSAAEPVARSLNAVDILAADVPSLTLALPTGRGDDGSDSGSSRGADGGDMRSSASDAAARTVTLVSAHTKSPMRGCREWSDGIRALAKLGTANRSMPALREAGGTSAAGAMDMVILGDLNANINHPSFRELLRNGDFRDAGMELGLWRLPRPTYPSWIPWPRITLDHALFSAGLDAEAVRTIVVPGTDHLALCASLGYRA